MIHFGPASKYVLHGIFFVLLKFAQFAHRSFCGAEWENEMIVEEPGKNLSISPKHYLKC